MFGITCKGRFNRTQYWIRKFIIMSVFIFNLISNISSSTNRLDNLDEKLIAKCLKNPDLIFDIVLANATQEMEKDILLIRHNSTNLDNDLATPKLLEETLNTIDTSYKQFNEKMIAYTLKTTEEAKQNGKNLHIFQVPEQEITNIFTSNRKNFKYYLENMIKDSKVECPKIFNLLRPLANLIKDAKQIPIDLLENHSKLSVLTEINNFSLFEQGIFITMFYIYIIVYSITVDVRRGHDLGISGLITFLLYLIPIINIIYMLIYLGFVKGTPKLNQYNN